jgi:hypothetical protein
VRFSLNCPLEFVDFPHRPVEPQQDPVIPPHFVSYDCKFSWFVEVLHITSPNCIPPMGIGAPVWSST